MTEAQAFVVLGLPTTADWHTIKAAYREAVRIYHPDGETPDVAQFQRVVAAYRVLAATEATRDLARHTCDQCTGAGVLPVRCGWRTLGTVRCAQCTGSGRI